MKAYKGFNKDFCCMGMQYEIGKTQYQEGTIKCCKNGLHSCTNPLDVLKYYRNGRYAIVEVEGDISKNTEDSKIASSKLTPIKEIIKEELIQESLKDAKVGDYLSSNGKIFALNTESFGFIKIGIIVDIKGNNYTIMSLHESNNVNWYEAKEWAENYSIMGIANWQLPDKDILLNKCGKFLKKEHKYSWYWSSNEVSENSYSKSWGLGCGCDEDVCYCVLSHDRKGLSYYYYRVRAVKTIHNNGLY